MSNSALRVSFFLGPKNGRAVALMSKNIARDKKRVQDCTQSLNAPWLLKQAIMKVSEKKSKLSQSILNQNKCKKKISHISKKVDT